MTAEAADAERTDAIAKDWEKAVSYAITDEDIERAKLLVGVDVAAKSREYIQTATTDNIRNFAHGCGTTIRCTATPTTAARPAGAASSRRG